MVMPTMVASSESMIHCSSSAKINMTQSGGKISSQIPLVEINPNSLCADYSPVAGDSDTSPLGKSVLQIRSGKQLKKTRSRQVSQSQLAGSQEFLNKDKCSSLRDGNARNELTLSRTRESTSNIAMNSLSKNFPKRLSESFTVEGKPLGGTVKRNSSHRSTCSENSGKRFRQVATHRARTPETSTRGSTSVEPSFRNSGIINSVSDHIVKVNKSGLADTETLTRNDATPSPSQEQSFPQSAIDTAFVAGAALFRLVRPKSKKSTTNLHEDTCVRLNNPSVLKEVPSWVQVGPPARPAPTPPILEYPDKVSLRSIDSSLAGHTYEIINFSSQTELHSQNLPDECSPGGKIDVLSSSIPESFIALDAICISHPPSRKTSIRRKRKKSKNIGTLTDDYLSLPQERPGSDFNESTTNTVSEAVYSIPCPSPVMSPCPTPPLRHTSLYRDSSCDSRSSLKIMINETNVSSFCTPIGSSKCDNSTITPRNSTSNLDERFKLLQFQSHSQASQSAEDQVTSSNHSQSSSSLPTYSANTYLIKPSSNVCSDPWQPYHMNHISQYEVDSLVSLSESLGSVCSRIYNSDASVEHQNNAPKTGGSYPNIFRDTSIPVPVGLAENRSSLPNRSFLDRIRKSLRFSSTSMSEEETPLQEKANSVDHIDRRKYRTQLSLTLDKPKKICRSNSLVDPVEDFKKFRPNIPSIDRSSGKSDKEQFVSIFKSLM